MVYDGRSGRGTIPSRTSGPDDRPGPSAAHVVEQVVDDRHEALRRSSDEERPRAPAEGGWSASPSLRISVTDSTPYAISSIGPRSADGVDALLLLGRHDLAGRPGSGRPGRPRACRRGAPGRPPRRRPRSAAAQRRQPASSAAPRAGRRGRACTAPGRHDGGHTTGTCSSSRRHVDRTRYSTPPAPATHAAEPGRVRRRRSGRHPPRRAAARRGGVAGGARCARGRTAARAGRSRRRPGRSRRCPTAQAPPGRPETSSRDRPVVAASASIPSRGSQPSAPRTAATAPAGRGVGEAMERAALARRSRARPRD